MFRYTERVGELELSYEGETVQDVVDLKNAINPRILFVKKDSSKDFSAAMKSVADMAKGGVIT